jgi:hypothetical protein
MRAGQGGPEEAGQVRRRGDQAGGGLLGKGEVGEGTAVTGWPVAGSARP